MSVIAGLCGVVTVLGWGVESTRTALFGPLHWTDHPQSILTGVAMSPLVPLALLVAVGALRPRPRLLAAFAVLTVGGAWSEEVLLGGDWFTPTATGPMGPGVLPGLAALSAALLLRREDRDGGAGADVNAEEVGCQDGGHGSSHQPHRG